jgi:hypothetical protein
MDPRKTLYLPGIAPSLWYHLDEMSLYGKSEKGMARDPCHDYHI